MVKQPSARALRAQRRTNLKQQHARRRKLLEQDRKLTQRLEQMMQQSWFSRICAFQELDALINCDFENIWFAIMPLRTRKAYLERRLRDLQSSHLYSYYNESVNAYLEKAT